MAHMKFGTHEVEGLNIQFGGQVSRANAVEQHPEVGFFADVSVTLAVSEKSRNMGPPLASNQYIDLENLTKQLLPEVRSSESLPFEALWCEYRI